MARWGKSDGTISAGFPSIVVDNIRDREQERYVQQHSEGLRKSWISTVGTAFKTDTARYEVRNCLNGLDRPNTEALRVNDKGPEQDFLAAAAHEYSDQDTPQLLFGRFPSVRSQK